MTVNTEVYELLSRLRDFFQHQAEQAGTDDCCEAEWAKEIRALLARHRVLLARPIRQAR